MVREEGFEGKAGASEELDDEVAGVAELVDVWELDAGMEVAPEARKDANQQQKSPFLL